MRVRSFGENILWTGIILLPGLAILLGPFLFGMLIPAAKASSSVQTLFAGGAYAACDPPFRASIIDERNTSLNAECELVHARRMLRVRVDEPHGESPRRWAQDGVLLEFPVTYSERFNGKTVDVIIMASCEACTDPLQVNVIGQLFAGRDWQSASFGPSLTSQTFQFTLPERGAGEISQPLQIVIDPYQPNEDAIVRIASVAVNLATE